MIRDSAVRYAMNILRTAKDWQEAQTALGDHDIFGAWLDEMDAPISEAQSIIREAEERLGNDIPY
jgi:hypothetical protein